MYYYAALQATSIESLEGLRVLDVSHGQVESLNFLARHFKPRASVGYDSVKKQLTGTGLNKVLPATGSTPQMNLAQMLRSEKRFDLILCIETWNLLRDQDSFLSQVRELLSQSDE